MSVKREITEKYLLDFVFKMLKFSNEINHVELWSGKLARELMQNIRQINLIGLRGCFPVAHCDIIAKPSDLPEFFCFNNHYWSLIYL